MSNKRILDKIKKLMAMVERGNEHESANAMKKIQALMEEHKLSSDELELSGIDSSTVTCANNSNTQPAWSHALVSLITHVFGVKAIFTNAMTNDFKQVWKVMFIGPADRVEISGYVYTVLARQLKAARRDFILTLNKRIKTKTKTARADLFCEGWCSGVRHKVKALLPSAKELELIERFKQKRFQNLEGAKAREAKVTQRDHGAYSCGLQASENVELNAGVRGQEQMKLAAN